MNSREFATSALIALVLGSTATIMSNQLDLKLDSSSIDKNPAQETKKITKTIQVLNTASFTNWTMGVCDVLVIGSGASGFMTGLSALWALPKARVVVLEKESSTGGTTAKSGGVFYLPDHVLNTREDRTQTIAFMARMAYPEVFDQSKEWFGLQEEDYNRTALYFDLGWAITERLKEFSPNLNVVKDMQGEPIWDYQYSQTSQPDNKLPQGRHLGVGMFRYETSALMGLRKFLTIVNPALRMAAKHFPLMREFTSLEQMWFKLDHGLGVHLIRTLQTEFQRLGGEILLSSDVDGLVLDETEAAVGVRIVGNQFIGATRGVVFASGGFSQNRELVNKYIENHSLNARHIERTGASVGNTGDFLVMCEKMDIEIRSPEKIWGCEAHMLHQHQNILADQAEQDWETGTCLFQMRGDSFFVVGPQGKRVYNEKSEYDARARAHWNLPSNSCANPKRGVFFMIADERCVDLFGGEGLALTWPRDFNDPRYVKGETMEELAQNLIKRFPDYVNLSTFQCNLQESLIRFNELAKQGFDEDFDRGGRHLSDRQHSYKVDRESMENQTMFPLSSSGPYYAVALVASAIDTKGGPAVDCHQRVLKTDGDVVDRLYACGNAAYSPTGDAHISGGGTLGACFVTGYCAGMEAVLRGPGGATAAVAPASSKL